MRSAAPIDILDPREIQRGINPRVYVVGSGPNGGAHWNRIPKQAHVIVVNRAINIEGLDKTWWMCEDDTLPEQDWFREIVAYNRDHLISWSEGRSYHGDLAPMPIFMNGSRVHRVVPTDYVFFHAGIWDTAVRKLAAEPPCEPPFTYGGATIACRATQVAALRGAREIILVGVDMSGPKHFDGQSTAIPTEDREGAWTQVDRFNTIIRWLERSTHCTVKSLSATALAVPVIPREDGNDTQ